MVSPVEHPPMGPAIDALGPAVAVTRRNPALLSAALASLALTGVATLVLGMVPVVGDLLNTLVVAPAVTALLLGMALAGLATDAASFSDGVASVRSNYRHLVGAYAVLVVAMLVLVVAFAVVAAVALVVGLGPEGAAGLGGTGARAGGTGVDPAASRALLSSGPVLLVAFCALAVALVGGLAVQFFDVAIVVGGATALSSFGASWRLFRHGPASVLGYSVLRMLPVVGAVAVVGVGYGVTVGTAGDAVGTVVALVLAAVVGPVAYAFAMAYHVAYYDARVERLEDDEPA